MNNRGRTRRWDEINWCGKAKKTKKARKEGEERERERESDRVPGAYCAGKQRSFFTEQENSGVFGVTTGSAYIDSVSVTLWWMPGCIASGEYFFSPTSSSLRTVKGGGNDKGERVIVFVCVSDCLLTICMLFESMLASWQPATLTN